MEMIDEEGFPPVDEIRDRSKKVSEEKKCLCCNVKSSSRWRRSNFDTTLCNRCYTRVKKSEPFFLHRDVSVRLTKRQSVFLYKGFLEYLLAKKEQDE